MAAPIRKIRLTVLPRCESSWSAMPGTAHVRHCSSCDKPVHNLSAMSSQRVLELLSSSEPICVHYIPRPDGSVETDESGMADRFKIRWLRTQALALAASLTAAPSFAQTSLVRPAIQTAPARTPESATPQTSAASIVPHPSISGDVFDTANFPLPGATVTLQDGERTVATITTDASGHFTFDGVAADKRYSVTAMLPGFTTYRSGPLSATRPSSDLTIHLSVGLVGEVVSIESTHLPPTNPWQRIRDWFRSR